MYAIRSYYEISAIFQPNVERSTINAASFTIGDVIKNENVIPRGTPASINPINSGIDEQEQNGEKTPNSAAMKFPEIPEYFSKIFFAFSGCR